jgi:hypothetical protein
MMMFPAASIMCASVPSLYSVITRKGGENGRPRTIRVIQPAPAALSASGGSWGGGVSFMISEFLGVRVYALGVRPTDQHARERQPVSFAEPFHQRRPVLESVRLREVVHSYRAASAVDPAGQPALQSLFADRDRLGSSHNRFTQHALLAPIRLAFPCAEADSVASFRHPFRHRAHRLEFLATLDESRELGLEHPHKRGRTRRSWTTPTSLLVCGVAWLRF